MNTLLLLVTCVLSGAFAEAEKCSSSNCQLQDNCACLSTNSPVASGVTPQFVTLTIDDSVTSSGHDLYWEKILFHRKNPDGSPIGASFYVPHQYTDYQKVNNLYNKGYEIGVNSISKGSPDYFQSAAVNVLVDEFLGQRKILSKFANIPISEIKGARTPHLGFASDSTFKAYSESGLEYDNSWTTFANNPIFPYTLNYKSNQECMIGSCPTETHPGFWIAPIVNFYGTDNYQCNVLFACIVNDTAIDINNWLIQQYERSRSGARAPLSLLVNSAWFTLKQNSFAGLQMFLDYLGTQKDTFLVSHKELIRWAKNPVALDSYKPVVENRNQPCIKVICELPFQGEIRYMVSCNVCADVYPWLGNPEGIV